MIKRLSQNKEMSEMAYKVLFGLSLMVLFSVSSQMAHAGGDSTFSAIVKQLEDYAQGSFGLALSLAAIVVGLLGSAWKRDLWPFGIGIGIALGLKYIVPILKSIFTATII